MEGNMSRAAMRGTVALSSPRHITHQRVGFRPARSAHQAYPRIAIPRPQAWSMKQACNAASS
jgi:hypothetical protein